MPVIRQEIAGLARARPMAEKRQNPDRHPRSRMTMRWPSCSRPDIFEPWRSRPFTATVPWRTQPAMRSRSSNSPGSTYRSRPDVPNRWSKAPDTPGTPRPDRSRRGDIPAPSRRPIETHAVDLIIELASRHRGELVVALIGPQTNFAVALKREPRLKEWVREVTIMGGSTTFGNITPVAEFNVPATRKRRPSCLTAEFRSAWSATT